MSEKKSDLSDSDKLSKISLLFSSMDAVIKSMYDALDECGTKGGHAYGLTMALENLNDQVGRQVGAI